MCDECGCDCEADWCWCDCCCEMQDTYLEDLFLDNALPEDVLEFIELKLNNNKAKKNGTDAT